MFLGHKGPTEGNMFGFCVSTVRAKILWLNAVFKHFRDQVCGLFQGFCCRGGITGPEEGLHLYVGGGLPLNTIQVVLIDSALPVCVSHKGGRGRHFGIKHHQSQVFKQSLVLAAWEVGMLSLLT